MNQINPKTDTYLERDRNLTRLAEVHVGGNLALIGAVRVFTFFLGVVVNYYFLKISKLAKKALWGEKTFIRKGFRDADHIEQLFLDNPIGKEFFNEDLFVLPKRLRTHFQLAITTHLAGKSILLAALVAQLFQMWTTIFEDLHSVQHSTHTYWDDCLLETRACTLGKSTLELGSIDHIRILGLIFSSLWIASNLNFTSS